jgi:hypothetical protein
LRAAIYDEMTEQFAVTVEEMNLPHSRIASR